MGLPVNLRFSVFFFLPSCFSSKKKTFRAKGAEEPLGKRPIDYAKHRAIDLTFVSNVYRSMVQGIKSLHHTQVGRTIYFLRAGDQAMNSPFPTKSKSSTATHTRASVERRCVAQPHVGCSPRDITKEPIHSANTRAYICAVESQDAGHSRSEQRKRSIPRILS